MQTHPDSRPDRRGTQPLAVTESGLMRAIGPMIAGLAIDGLDLMTFGPIGLYAGLILGGVVGYWLAPMLGFPPKGRWLAALMTGIYCTIPLTGFIPAAAIAAGLTRALSRGDTTPVAQSDDPALRPEGSIDVEFESKEIDPKTRRPR